MKKSKPFFAMLVAPSLLFSLGNNIKAQNYPEMVTVAGGAFYMGNELGEGNTDELPVHYDTLNTFKIARTETTVLQWRTYCEATGIQMPEIPFWGWIDNDPIVNVNWDDAVGYCNWLTKRTGKLYRLPTEAEFEFAARGGDSAKGLRFSGSQNLQEVGWFTDNSGGHPHPVATKKPNELGLYDMSGNVWEWCGDWYGVYKTNPASNSKGPASGTHRVLRGGCWYCSGILCRVASRNHGIPGYPHYFGFRVAATQ